MSHAKGDRRERELVNALDEAGTDGGNYRVKKETALAEGTDFPEFTGQSEKVTLAEAAADGSVDDGLDEEILRVLNAVEQGVMDVEEAAELLE